MTNDKTKLQLPVVVCLLVTLQAVTGYVNQPKYYMEADGHSLQSSFSGIIDYDRHSLYKRAASSGTQAPIVVTDFHNYYNSSYYSYMPDYYIDLDSEENQFTTITHHGLSSDHLKASRVELPFTFSFYGHNITSAYIATGGFLYVGTAVHDFLTVTQYIAPLMGNFDSSINDSSSVIRFASNDTAFTVEWKNIHVHHLEDAGGFTFQTTLMKDGRIIFAYKTIPVPVEDIRGGSDHSVTVGLSDGFYIDEPVYEGSTVQKRTIYKYHEVSMETSKVYQWSAFAFSPLRTCNQLTSCSDCTSQAGVIHFDCSWCSTINHCSSGFDRNRDDWVDNSCDLEAVNISAECPTKLIISAFVIIAILVAATLFIAGVGWVYYAYKYPNSSSGLCLIQAQSCMRGKCNRDNSNENNYIVEHNRKEDSLEHDIKVTVANGSSPAIITTTQTTSEA